MTAATDDPSAEPWMAWAPPWDGVSAKLVQAWRHFLVLTAETQEFISQPPLTTEAAAAPERGPNWLRFDLVVTHPEPHISLTLGDFLHNLRCALDHSLTVIDSKAGRRALFPTCLTEADFESWAADWTANGGDGGPLAAIRALQPFHGAKDQNPEDFVLRIVARLNNADKHRLINLTPVGLSDEMPPDLNIKASAPVLNYEYLLPGGYPLKDRQTAIYVELSLPVAQASVQLEGTIPIAVTVEDYFDVVGLGARLHKAVAKACANMRYGFINGWPT